MLQKNNKNNRKYNLPDHQPDERVWMKIEQELGFQHRLSELLPNLPVHEPDENAWDKIAAQLPVEEKSGKRISFPGRILSVAASIAVVLVLSTMLMLMNRDGLTNDTANTYTTLTESDMEQEAIAEIRNYCNLHMPACDNPDYKALMDLYEELKAEESALKNAMNQLGDSPEMIRALIKIENLKSETLQDLIILMQS